MSCGSSRRRDNLPACTWLTALRLTWNVTMAGRFAFGVLILLASIVNTITVLTVPQACHFFKDQ